MLAEIKFTIEFVCSQVVVALTLDFYCGAAMLKYEHPMMVLTKTKDVFLKRIKRMKKMIASDCSSQ